MVRTLCRIMLLHSDRAGIWDSGKVFRAKFFTKVESALSQDRRSTETAIGCLSITL